MKKTFKFFMCAAIVAASFTACSDEVVPGPGPGPDPTPVPEGEATYATFKFDVSNAKVGTRASGTASDMEEGEFNDAGSKNDDYTISKVRLLVFNANDQLEAKETGNTGMRTATVRLMSGRKKILVLANEPAEATTHFDTYTVVDPAVPSSVGTTYSQVMGDVNKFDVWAWNGTAPADSTDYVGGNGNSAHDITRLIGTLSSGKRPFIMSNSDDSHAYYTLNPRVSEDDSKDPSSLTGAPEDYNHFTITIKRAAAKGVITFDDAQADILKTKDGLGTLTESSLVYGIDNVERSAYLFQQFEGINIASPYYTIPTWTNDGKREHFYPYFYKMYNINIPLVKASTTASSKKTVYFTENTKSTLVNGNVTYAAIEAEFIPAAGKWVSAVDFNRSLGLATLTPGTGTRSNKTIYAMWLKNANIAFANSANTFEQLYLFDTEDLAYKALYLAKYETLYGNSHQVISDLASADWQAGWRPSSSIAHEKELVGAVDEYKDGICYYRMDIGEGTLGTSFDYSVKRNTQYYAKITGFKTIGVNDRRKLDNDPYAPKQQITHVTATITVLDWDEVVATGEV